jgi:hypothetical protein
VCGKSFQLERQCASVLLAHQVRWTPLPSFNAPSHVCSIRLWTEHFRRPVARLIAEKAGGNDICRDIPASSAPRIQVLGSAYEQ